MTVPQWPKRRPPQWLKRHGFTNGLWRLEERARTANEKRKREILARLMQEHEDRMTAMRRLADEMEHKS